MIAMYEEIKIKKTYSCWFFFKIQITHPHFTHFFHFFRDVNPPVPSESEKTMKTKNKACEVRTRFSNHIVFLIWRFATYFSSPFLQTVKIFFKHCEWLTIFVAFLLVSKLLCFSSSLPMASIAHSSHLF